MALVLCPECKKEVSSSAASCPHCGYAINATPHTDLSRGTNSQYYPQLREYVEKVNSFFVISIFALVLCMGIGIVFSVINLVKSANFRKMDMSWADKLVNPAEIAEYNKAKRKQKNAAIMTAIGWGVSVFLITIIIMGSLMSL